MAAEAGLPNAKAWVWVGPPLLVNGPSLALIGLAKVPAVEFDNVNVTFASVEAPMMLSLTATVRTAAGFVPMSG